MLRFDRKDEGKIDIFKICDICCLFLCKTSQPWDQTRLTGLNKKYFSLVHIVPLSSFYAAFS